MVTRAQGLGVGCRQPSSRYRIVNACECETFVREPCVPHRQVRSKSKYIVLLSFLHILITCSHCNLSKYNYFITVLMSTYPDVKEENSSDQNVNRRNQVALRFPFPRPFQPLSPTKRLRFFEPGRM